jgi:membrane protein implicated in regulation of membrane protease activity
MNRLSQNGSIRFLGILLTWMGLSLAISLAVSFILPFPWSLAVIIGIFLLLDFYLTRKANRRMRNGQRKSREFVSLIPKK